MCVCIYSYIGHWLKQAIERAGATSVMAVVLDGGGDWSATEKMIQSFFPWISFLHCVSHEVSLIIKDCFKEDGGITELVETNEWITNCQHWFTTHACASFLRDQAQPGEKKTFVWPAVTRYCGVLLKWKRFLEMKPLLRRVVTSGVYTEKNFVDDPYPDVINGAEVWTKIDRVVQMMGPLLLLCRLADGQKPVMSKLHGTQLHVRKLMQDRAAAAGDGSVEQKICDIFLERWPEMQSEIASAAYMLEPLFVHNSSRSAACTIHLWKLARRVLGISDDDEWTRTQGVLVEQLAKFQSKGVGLTHMSSPAAWRGLTSKCTLSWWIQWGVEVPELQSLAKKIVPLMVGSGPAERTWKDIGNVLTKNRNRMDTQTCINLVFVRTWLRREFKLVSDEELECFKEWEVELMRQASFYSGDVDPDAGREREKRIFEDRFEAWESDAIDGTGQDPPLRLGVVKRNKQSRFRLQEKYKNLCFVDKDPDNDNNFYETGGGAGPMPTAAWEHRKILGLTWENRKGWRVETKICNDMSGPSTNYVINEVLIRMIRDSSRNRNIRFRSTM